nr:immunoglobulin light chain junction region [Macaca mulatta]
CSAWDSSRTTLF